jgi:hypothetical protein
MVSQRRKGAKAQSSQRFLRIPERIKRDGVGLVCIYNKILLKKQEFTDLLRRKNAERRRKGENVFFFSLLFSSLLFISSLCSLFSLLFSSFLYARILCGLCVSAVNGLTYIENINDNY